MGVSVSVSVGVSVGFSVGVGISVGVSVGVYVCVYESISIHFSSLLSLRIQSFQDVQSDDSHKGYTVLFLSFSFFLSLSLPLSLSLSLSLSHSLSRSLSLSLSLSLPLSLSNPCTFSDTLQSIHNAPSPAPCGIPKREGVLDSWWVSHSVSFLLLSPLLSLTQSEADHFHVLSTRVCGGAA